MVSIANDVLAALRRAHTESGGDVDLGVFLARFGDLGDDELADLIELDARERLRCGKSVELPRYLRAIPDLASRRVALDAAIEFALRSLSGSRHTKVEAVEALCEAYPDLVPAISAAWFLNDALGSTAGGTAPGAAPVEIQVPMGIGPMLGSGRNRYELRERLGRGSHGSVYLAVDYALSEADRAAWVAVKVTGIVPGSSAIAHRVMEEATKARRVTHPNIARVLDRGTLDEGREFVVYEHVDAGDLQDAFDRGRLSRQPRDIVRLVAKIARAVQAAHSAGLIHSDLKPSNILLTSSGEPKVADFGLAARRFDLEEKGERVQLGTLGFIAPERYRAEPGSEGVASDVYALGGILYYLLTGRAPNGSNADEVAERLGGDPATRVAPRISDAGVQVDEDLDAICARALAPRANDRYASADALANDLEAWLEHRPLTWRRPRPLRMASLFVQRNPVLCAAAVGLLLVSIGATAAVMQVQHEEHDKRMQLEVEAAERLAGEQRKVAQEQKKSIDEARRLTGSMTAALLARSQGLNEEWMSFLTVTEALAGPKLFDQSARAPFDDMWAARIQVARDRIEEARGEGRLNDSDTLLWRVALGYWLNKSGKFTESRRILEGASKAWSDRVGDEDTWATYAALLEWSATIRETAAAAKGSGIRPQDRERAATAVDRIVSRMAIFSGSREGNNVHREVVEALVLAYSPLMFNRPDDHAAYQRVLSRWEND